MKTKILFKSLFFAVGIVLPSIFISVFTLDFPDQWFSVKSVLSANTQTSNKQMKPTKNIIPAKPITYGLPVRLKIPSIRVDAAIEQMGILSNGSMQSPRAGKNVGWFQYGSRPGEDGSAVIAGHYGPWQNGKGSVFDNLNTLKKGDKIYIKDNKGVTVTFVVRESRTYDQKADASKVFNSNDGKSHLNLITCEGAWNKTIKGYSKRLVIFADKE